MANKHPVLVPRLICDDCDAAIAFYASVFGATEQERFTSPDGVIVHAAITIDGATISLADAAPDFGNYSPDMLGGSPVILTLLLDDPDKTASVAETHGATILIPVDDRFYGQREGRIRDPFGHLWILSKEVKTMTPQEIQAGVDQFDQ